MAEAAVDVDPDFEPQSRPRSCTWPLQRPEPDGPEPAAAGPVLGEAGGCQAEGRAPAPTPKKGGSRRNAWGNQSYAELISQAIESSPDKRLTLAQIYDWMVKSVPYFKDKGDSNSSAGWKNSIRHNLSLHSKFTKVHNESTGKSSWWMLNPEGGKSGKAPRRRAASMDNTSKVSKVRGKASKKKAALQAAPDAPADSPDSQFPKWPGSPSARSNEEADVWSFRPRTSSDASTISIRPEEEDEQDEEIHSSLVYSNSSSSVPPTVTEELELIDSLNLLSPASSMQSVASSFSLQPPSASSRTSSFGNSLFNPVDIPLQSSANRFTGPQTLEALLTSDSPPPSDVMMTQVDPILTQTGNRMLLLGGQAAQSKLSLLGKPLELLPTSIGTGTLPSTLTLLASSQSTAALTTLKAPASANSVVQLSSQPPLPSASMASFVGMNYDRLPTDLDGDMYMENLECDVDYIINSDLMDEEGLDFNLDPIMPNASYPGTTQASTHSWVPS